MSKQGLENKSNQDWSLYHALLRRVTCTCPDISIIQKTNTNSVNIISIYHRYEKSSSLYKLETKCWNIGERLTSFLQPSRKSSKTQLESLYHSLCRPRLYPGQLSAHTRLEPRIPFYTAIGIPKLWSKRDCVSVILSSFIFISKNLKSYISYSFIKLYSALPSPPCHNHDLEHAAIALIFLPRIKIKRAGNIQIIISANSGYSLRNAIVYPRFRRMIV